MIDKKTEKLKRKIRNLEWHQKIDLMDWLNSWYFAYKEEKRLNHEEEFMLYDYEGEE